ncbi:hypothetical protein N9312_01275 [Bacteroidia bacterium]|jgi:hypothetical protein|nr:hypothetical protein [Bacteroidia bacterium]
MKLTVLHILFISVIILSVSSCKARHCPALQDDMEGYNPKSAKKKKGRQEGLWGK